MTGFVDLHCHWLCGLDDGAPSRADGLEMLQRLAQLGFVHVVATPHMRPGLFDNTRQTILEAFDVQRPAASAMALDVSAEHYFDDVVFQRLRSGQGVPYPGDRSALLEFYAMDLPPRVDHLLSRLKREGITPVIAHPERYSVIGSEPKRLEDMVDAGALSLLDAGALVGKYGKSPQRLARRLLEHGLYHAACSDAHRPKDLQTLEEAMEWIVRHYGTEELEALFCTGPRQILQGDAVRGQVSP